MKFKLLFDLMMNLHKFNLIGSSIFVKRCQKKSKQNYNFIFRQLIIKKSVKKSNCKKKKDNFLFK